MRTLEVEHFGAVAKARLEFADLTVLVDEQATGKSLLVQLYKTLNDASSIRLELKKFGFDWHRSIAAAGW